MKKKIRYSDFPVPAPPAPTAERASNDASAEAPAKRVRKRPAADAASPAAEAHPVAESMPVAAAVPVIVPPPPAAPRPTTSFTLGSLGPGADAPARQSGGRLTPMSGMRAIPAPAARGTPARGSVSIPTPRRQLTPVRGSVAIPVPHGTPTPIHGSPAIGASRALRERVRSRVGTAELLLFRVGEELFGMELAVVEEAIDLPEIRHVPEMPPAMLGVITVRGSLTSIYSPERALGLSLGQRGSALIFRRGAGRVALVVDDVDDIFTLDLALLRDAPGIDGADGVLLGVLRRDDALLALVDAEALIAACQAAPVLETV